MTQTQHRVYPGNTALVKHGIQTEQSDLRAHVCPVAGMVYVYPTKEGVAAINTGNHRQLKTRTGAIVTAVGYVVPPSAILRVAKVKLGYLLTQYPIAYTDSTTHKGKQAVNIVAELFRLGAFPLYLGAQETRSMELQISGTDILIDAKVKLKVQVKCDYNGGEPAKGERSTPSGYVTGNLYLQTEECNPLKQY